MPFVLRETAEAIEAVEAVKAVVPVEAELKTA